jgi:ligand-binding sensor domain-containing protein
MKSRYAYLFFIQIVFLISPYIVDAQPKRLQFRHLTTDDGLSHSWVHSIIQDKYGFIWVGTDDCLNRYDVYNFRIYKNGHLLAYFLA